MLAVTLGWMLFVSALATASETVLLNSSPARDCYLATLEGGTVFEIEVCTLAIEKQMLTPADLAATYSNRGILRVRNGDVKLGLKDHDRALSLMPDLTSAYINRSNALVVSKRYQAALADLEVAIAKQDGLLPIAYYNRALMFRRLGDLEAARTDAERAAALAPGNAAYQDFVRTLR